MCPIHPPQHQRVRVRRGPLIALLAATILTCEGIAFVGLHFVASSEAVKPVNDLSERHATIIRRFLRGESSHQRPDSFLGWDVTENHAGNLYRINAAGIRSDHEYARSTPPGVLRVSTYGNSFTFGDEVANDNTWQALLEGKSNNMEVLNFGVGGFGLDQSYLKHLREGGKYGGQVVLIGFMPENIYRNVSRFRPFYHPRTGLPFGKPRFLPEGSSVRLLGNPLPSPDAYQLLLNHPRRVLKVAGTHDHFYNNGYKAGSFDFLALVRLWKFVNTRIKRATSPDRISIGGRYNPNSEAFVVTTRLFERFVDTVRQNDATPIIVVFPDQSDLRQYQRKGLSRYSPLTDYFEARNIQYIDLMWALLPKERQGSTSQLFLQTHYSPKGNRLIAEYLYRQLLSDMLAEPGQEPAQNASLRI